MGSIYDDGILSSYFILKLLEENKNCSLSSLKNELKKTWVTPTINAYCHDKVKYAVVDRMKIYLDEILKE
ncbi:MAG: hypothetical protein ACJ0AN_05755 [Alphaproteobacteria bacterium]